MRGFIVALLVVPALLSAQAPQGQASSPLAGLFPEQQGPAANYLGYAFVQCGPANAPGLRIVALQGLIPEGIPKEDKPSDLAGAEQGVNDFGNVGYDGPAPPPGRGVHRYQFQLFALDEMLSLPPEVTKLALMWTMEGHILGKGMLRGLYSR